MASLVSVAEVRAIVKTALTDPQLQEVIDREEAEVIQRFGAHYVDGSTTVTETVEGSGGQSQYLRRRITSISSITEDDVALTSDDYRLWGAQGRVQRLPAGSVWTTGVLVLEYVPANDNLQRKSVIIELVGLALSRPTLQSESIGGEYSYTALAEGEWLKKRKAAYQRLAFVGAG